MSYAATSRSGSIRSMMFLGLKILLALLFVAAACAKIFGVPMMVREFAEVGLGQWLRYVTALLEITGAVLLFVPGRTAIGGALLTCVCVGAFFAQLIAIHMDVVHTIILGGICAAITWTHRAELPGL